jgi:predicted negative regulator of RcsB-dependent stress response
MSGTYITEEEQVEQLKKFFKQYGMSLLLGLVLALGGSYGFKMYQARQRHNSEQASLIYSQLMNSVTNNERKQITHQANYLITEYPNSVYATLAKLMLAKQAISDNHLQDARSQLTSVMNNKRFPNFSSVARVRLARLAFHDKQYKKALKLLEPLEHQLSFVAYKEQLTGDIMLAMGSPIKAKLAYKKALDLYEGNASLKPVVEMKLDNVTA